jgi:hypothetical protein
MVVDFFKSRCLVCWKSSKVPLLTQSFSVYNLYYDISSKTFSYFNWFDNERIQHFVLDFLSKNPNLQTLNDETKGNTTLHIIALMADGDKEYISGYNRCPRCGLKFNFLSDTKTHKGQIETLHFKDFFGLNDNKRQQYLSDRIKNGL